ncbi:MAG: GTP pyrophosphokinase family protein [Clostridiales bacterium]
MIIEKKSSFFNLKNVNLNERQERIFGSLQNYLEMSHIYRSAMSELGTKLENLDEEFHVRFDRNPIHHMEARLKSPQSIIDKLAKKGKDISMESAKANISDIAGIRVICYYIQDIYSIVDLLSVRDDINLINIADYIKEPKPSGYRSLHMDVSVPVVLSDKTEHVPVEIQVRTIAMDFWASVEHQLRYKSPDAVPVSLRAQLKDIAQTIADTDVKMEEIYAKLEEL